MRRSLGVLAAASTLALAGCAGAQTTQTAAAPTPPPTNAAASPAPTVSPTPTASATPSAATIPVTYTVTANAPVRRIDWASVGGYSNAENVTAPWTQEFDETPADLAQSSFSVDVSGSDASTQIACSISVGGKVVVSHSATGADGMANCAYNPPSQ